MQEYKVTFIFRNSPSFAEFNVPEEDLVEITNKLELYFRSNGKCVGSNWAVDMSQVNFYSIEKGA